MNDEANRQRLGKLVTAARLRKYRTVDRARVAAEVARGTWEKVERGERVKDFSLAAIEAALDWPEGFVQGILDGDEVEVTPTGLSEPDAMELLRQLQIEQREMRRELDLLRRQRPPETG